MSTGDGFRRHLGRADRAAPAPSTAAAATTRGRTTDGINTGWAGGSGGGGNMPQVAGAQEVVLSTSGGLGEAETAGVILNVIPREGGNTFSGQFTVSGANGAMQGSNYTQELKDRGPAVAVRSS